MLSDVTGSFLPSPVAPLSWMVKVLRAGWDGQVLAQARDGHGVGGKDCRLGAHFWSQLWLDLLCDSGQALALF